MLYLEIKFYFSSVEKRKTDIQLCSKTALFWINFGQGQQNGGVTLFLPYNPIFHRKIWR